MKNEILMKTIKEHHPFNEGRDITVARVFDMKDLEKLARGTVVQSICNDAISYFWIYEHIHENQILFDTKDGAKIHGWLCNPSGIIFRDGGQIYVRDVKYLHYGKSGRRLPRALNFFKQAGLLSEEEENIIRGVK